MKKLFQILSSILILLLCLTCKKADTSHSDFYNIEDRIGIWVNSERGDTLEFTNSISLIRRYSFFSSPVQYNYRVSDDILYIQEPSSLIESEHPILKVEDSKVKLGNMYITFGFEDNAGIFNKIK